MDGFPKTREGPRAGPAPPPDRQSDLESLKPNARSVALTESRQVMTAVRKARGDQSGNLRLPQTARELPGIARLLAASDLGQKTVAIRPGRNDL
jgi:hypothetical protein